MLQYKAQNDVLKFQSLRIILPSSTSEINQLFKHQVTLVKLALIICLLIGLLLNSRTKPLLFHQRSRNRCSFLSLTSEVLFYNPFPPSQNFFMYFSLCFQSLESSSFCPVSLTGSLYQLPIIINYIYKPPSKFSGLGEL